MTHYKIVHDENAIREYLDWIPDLEVNEMLLVTLFSRNKYSEQKIKSSDKTQLGRKTTTKERLIQKLHQMELPIGAWKINGVNAPPESLVTYLTFNPRCMKKASWALVRRMQDILENDGSKGYNPAAEALSAIQKSRSRKIITIFDVDEKEGVNPSLIYSVIPPNAAKDCVRVIETRGGYHIHVKSKMLKDYEGVDKQWYVKLLATYPVDKSKPQFSPIPGAYQGGWVPKLLIPGKDF